MCLGYAAQVLSVEDGVAVVEAHGRPQRVALLALPQPPAAGDWLLVYSGIALATITSEYAAGLDDVIRKGRAP